MATKHLIRYTAAVALFGLLSAWAVYSICYVPYRCNLRERITEARILELYERQHSYEVTLAARQIVETIGPCLASCKTRVNLYLVAAAAQRLMQRNEHALTLYHEALKYDRRPEIYLQIGITHLALGNRPAAREALVTANRFVYDPERLSLIRLDDQNRGRIDPGSLRSGGAMSALPLVIT